MKSRNRSQPGVVYILDDEYVDFIAHNQEQKKHNFEFNAQKFIKKGFIPSWIKQNFIKMNKKMREWLEIYL